jgi:DNA replication and repair protein RecF
MRERRVPVRVLRLARFRNYDAMEVQLHPRLNLFLGENAQGKTNILEALHCLSTTRSFRSASDDEMIAFGRDEAAVEAEADQELGRESLSWSSAGGGAKAYLLTVRRGRSSRNCWVACLRWCSRPTTCSW